jgi:hypothetical protein
MLVELCAVARDLGVSGDDIRLGAHATAGHCREGQSPLQLRLMKIATFNINNVNRRLPNLLRWLRRPLTLTVLVSHRNSFDWRRGHFSWALLPSQSA